MSLPPSAFVLSTEVNAGADEFVFRAHGERDDAARAVIVIGSAIAKMLGTEPDACVDPKKPWSERVDTLDALLTEASKSKKNTCRLGVLVDADALVSPDESPVDSDRTSRELRAKVVHVLVSSVQRGGWTVVRPSPSAELSEQLDIPLSEDSPRPEDPEWLEQLPSLAHPLALWLHGRDQLDKYTVEEIVESVEDPIEHLASWVYDSLPHSARQAARDVQALREPSALNGSFGPLRFNETFRKDAATHLIKSGLVTPASTATPDSFVMPRAVRHLLGIHARALDDERQRAVHLEAAQALHEKGEKIETSIEAHHHATEAVDVELARRTARYHAQDLRALATRLSIEESRFSDAAALFRTCVESFDSTDPYAWEYLGYNLALADDQSNERRRHHTEILEAYRRARRLAPNNALYHGRLLGYRAEHGELVGEEFNSGMSRYSKAGIPDDVSYFAKAVFAGLERGSRSPEAKQLASRWRAALRTHAPQTYERFATTE